ncbi:hypothetical protein [Aureimonas leprariae]|uniref:hypothetical protein n=1 Tax=Plantimonas leprariae TaxID=2615207 RepID=UPI001386E373|nr:hypothetical protein [Aureimonas leprariae]
MSNTPTLPDADVAEPIPQEEYDDDLVGVPDEESGVGADLPEPEIVNGHPDGGLERPV